MQSNNSTSTTFIPKWHYKALIALGVVTLVLCAFILRTSFEGIATADSQRSASARSDCRAIVNNARRSVFDNVDIYKAIEIEMLSTALLDRTNGITHTPAEQNEITKVYQDNDILLKQSLIEARKLQPSSTIDHIIEHGGTIDGVHYDACIRVK